MTDNKYEKFIISMYNEIFKHDLEHDLDTLDFNADITELGINSINFIKILIYIEENLNVQFKDNELSIKIYQNLNYLLDRIKEKVNENNMKEMA